MDTGYNNSEGVEGFNAGFRTPMQTSGRLDGSSEFPRQGFVFSPLATLSERQMNEEEEIPPQTHVSQTNIYIIHHIVSSSMLNEVNKM
jgi:hypothetical protein